MPPAEPACVDEMGGVYVAPDDSTLKGILTLGRRSFIMVSVINTINREETCWRGLC